MKWTEGTEAPEPNWTFRREQTRKGSYSSEHQCRLDPNQAGGSPAPGPVLAAPGSAGSPGFCSGLSAARWPGSAGWGGRTSSTHSRRTGTCCGPSSGWWSRGAGSGSIWAAVVPTCCLWFKLQNIFSQWDPAHRLTNQRRPPSCLRDSPSSRCPDGPTWVPASDWLETGSSSAGNEFKLSEANMKFNYWTLWTNTEKALGETLSEKYETMKVAGGH